MSVHQLSSNNFRVVMGPTKPILVLDKPGVVLVFFKMTNCPLCKNLEPVFFGLARGENGISYGILNLDRDRKVSNMSRDTSTPIKVVPTLIIYINGRPHAKPKGTNHTIQSLRSFISRVVSSQQAHPPQSSTSFMPPMSQSGGGRGYYPQQQSHQNKYYMPELNTSKFSSKKHVQPQLGGAEDEEEPKLETPNQVVPHNVPWEVGYRKINEMG